MSAAEGQLSGHYTTVCTAIATMKHYIPSYFVLVNQISWWHGNYSRFLFFYVSRRESRASRAPNLYCHDFLPRYDYSDIVDHSHTIHNSLEVAIKVLKSPSCCWQLGFDYVINDYFLFG